MTYRHKARMTPLRRQILYLVAKDYNNEKIAKKLDISLCNTKLQKWRLYCYLGDVHTAEDAVYTALQMKLLTKKDLSKSMKDKLKKSRLWNEL